MATAMQSLEAALAAKTAPRAPRPSPVTRAQYVEARAFVASRMVRTQADIDALLATRALQIAAE